MEELFGPLDEPVPLATPVGGAGIMGGGGGAPPLDLGLQAEPVEEPPAVFEPKPPRDVLNLKGECRTWRLRRKQMVGKGAFGSATLYTDIDTNEQIVVKDINRQCFSTAEDKQALETEIAIMKRARTHPNIVTYLDRCDDDPDDPFMMYIMMEYCDQGDLGVWVSNAQHSGKQPEEAFIASVAVQLFMALEYLQAELLVVHRDIKPQNLFLCADGRVKLADFGVSVQLSNGTETLTGASGSPYYIAPEIFEEKAYSGKVDLWSAGVALYEIMELRRPFNGITNGALVSEVRRGAYEKIEPVASTLLSPAGISSKPGMYSKNLCELVQSLLQVDPMARPQPRRLVSSQYARRMVGSVVPECCWSSTFYQRAFPEEAQRHPCASSTVSAKQAPILQVCPAAPPNMAAAKPQQPVHIPNPTNPAGVDSDDSSDSNDDDDDDGDDDDAAWNKKYDSDDFESD